MQDLTIRFQKSDLYLVELLVEPELEEFGRRVELVGRPDQKRQCVNLGSVFGTLCKILKFVFRSGIFER